MKRLLFLVLVLACDRTPPRDRAIAGVKRVVAADLHRLVVESRALRAAAPSSGWGVDSPALPRMRRHWASARDAYERIEGAIATLFAHYDVSIDGRYDGFVAVEGDEDLFDGDGVTGLHAIERVLWADAHPLETVRFESELRGYVPAEYPTTDSEARTFRDGLLERLERDCTRMEEEFEPLALDPAAAYRGVMGSIEEQVEKVMLAATGEDESRYSRRTLADMRANLAGGEALFAAMEPWLESADADDEANAVRQTFGELRRAYGQVDGDALPRVPDGWNPEAPSETDLATPYGRLFVTVSRHADPDGDGALSAMMRAASRLEIAVLPTAMPTTR